MLNKYVHTTPFVHTCVFIQSTTRVFTRYMSGIFLNDLHFETVNYYYTGGFQTCMKYILQCHTEKTVKSLDYYNYHEYSPSAILVPSCVRAQFIHKSSS